MPTRRNAKTATTFAGIIFFAFASFPMLAFWFLPNSRELPTLVVASLVAAIVASWMVFLVITKLPGTRRVRIGVWAGFAVVIALTLFSFSLKRITYARFGLTVYGVIPVPAFDFTVNRRGVLGLRPKSHQITRSELETLVDSDVEIVVVGIGWDSVAALTDEAKTLGKSIDLRVLPTPAAFELYNKLRSEGKTVVLLAHSTC